jgi:hypothetical protein
MMLTKDFIEIICNDRLSTRSSSFRLSSLIVIGSLCVVSLYMLNALEFERLRHLITQPFFQYVLTCLLLLYISCGKILLSLSNPGRYSAAGLVWVLLSVLLLWTPFLLVSVNPKFGMPVPALSLSHGMSSAFMLVVFALPWLALLFNHLRSMAPTRLVLTGAFAGMVSCALASMLLLVSDLKGVAHFHIYSASSAMLALSLMGALIGPRLLRW